MRARYEGCAPYDDFEYETVVNAPIDEVFAFFCRVENLAKLTPVTLGFKVLSKLPIEMRVGTLIDCQVRIRGIPVKWRTEISVWEPGKRFIDIQVKGPYRKWIHEHRFEPDGAGTRIWDAVEYAVPGGLLAPIVHNLFVRREIKSVFAYREKVLREAWITTNDPHLDVW